MIKAAIVGCGNIAGFLDAPGDERIVTHAHACARHDAIGLVACCDPDPLRRQAFCDRWGGDIRGYDSLEALLAEESVEMLCVCSPTPFHAQAVIRGLEHPHIRYILCEKPFVETREELERLSGLLKGTQKKVLVNFMRRFDPAIKQAAALIRSGELGELQHFSGTFTKGLYHNGSHMLELVEHLCGEITQLRADRVRVAEADLYGSFYLEAGSARGTLQNENGEHYALFELEIVLSKGRILIKDSGHAVEIEQPAPSPYYEGYFNLKRSTVLDDTMRWNLYHAADFLIDSQETDSILEKHLRLSRKLLDIKEHLAKKSVLHWEDHE